MLPPPVLTVTYRSGCGAVRRWFLATPREDVSENVDGRRAQSNSDGVERRQRGQLAAPLQRIDRVEAEARRVGQLLHRHAQPSSAHSNGLPEELPPDHVAV